MGTIKAAIATDLRIYVIIESLFKSLIVTDSYRTVYNSNFLLLPNFSDKISG